MSLNAMEKLLLADCPPVWKVVLMVIARHGRGPNGNDGRPGLQRLARLAGIGRSTLVQILGLLEAKGWLTWVKGSAERHTANTYTIHFDKIPMLDWIEAKPASPESGPGQNLDQSEIWPRPESELVQKASISSPESGPEASTEAKAKNKGGAPKTRAPLFVLPDWIPVQVWKDFEEMRRTIRKPMTDRARELVVQTLAKLREAGNPSAEVLEQSIRKSWQDVYPLNSRKPMNTATADPLAGMKFINVEARK